VSGLASSAARLVENDKVTLLDKEKDFDTLDSTNQASWSRYTYVFPAELFEEDGYYRLLLSSTDVAGNLSENTMDNKNEDRTGAFEVSFAVDKTPPTAILSNIEDNTAYRESEHRIDIFADDNMESESVTLIIDGEEAAFFTEEDLKRDNSFSYELKENDNPQNISLVVSDKAGNTTQTNVENVVVTNDVIRYVINTPAILYPIIATCAVLVIGLIVLSTMKIRKKGLS
jgi:hypothetical protein